LIPVSTSIVTKKLSLENGTTHTFGEAVSDGVTKLCLEIETRFPSLNLGFKGYRTQVLRLWILQRNGLVKSL